MMRVEYACNECCGDNECRFSLNVIDEDDLNECRKHPKNCVYKNADVKAKWERVIKNGKI